ncbi:MAG: hypothetical protein AUJ74_04460 [Candidatus Omnitrophica bacterium CG1_02_44_16]|nr:MAG: hypothetical protein AUJ74_04460 [Candidatus Omnitrophica bacterium CG1_02_44_16]PIY82582.1 MAG: hypothetical protein COY78_05950 [Candidatus Omnitrophica bacterium CG_4_10_14_0_8_um_filter_44_12]PIZ85099.1 MAG: hypothetical protein COX96_00455 [Candidatus Omnitrophica bacterium CG_4_10_14_0_2_um_filter_44_9]
MRKKYSIEVPLYSSSIGHLAKLNRLADIEIVLYGGAPNSPLNGGRFNYVLDGLFLWNRFFFSLTKGQLARAIAKFYETLAKANQNGISFRLAFTNMFVSPEELNVENLYPVKWLVGSYQKYGVKNGVILNNKLLEGRIRQMYGDKLVYVSSCTKYVSPNKLFTPKETLSMYLEDSGKYDLICLTPQDSRRAGLIKDVLRENKSGIIAVCNSYCSNCCNSYHHYAAASKENKRSILSVGIIHIIVGAFAFILPRILTCTALRQQFCRVDIDKIAKMQLDAGIVNFKLGRGLGANLINRLIALIKR